VPAGVADALRNSGQKIGSDLGVLAEACRERGERMPGLALRKLFEKAGEAYQTWNCKIEGYVKPSEEFGPVFESTQALRESFLHAKTVRELLRAEMIALQEEIDWLTYAAYGLLDEGNQAAQIELDPQPLDRELRPFCLWAQTEGDYSRANQLMLDERTESRKKVWSARLAAIRDIEHIRRIEQPVYKRRWDEQWKVGSEWRCGEIAYAAEFVDAFEYWVNEKAEWWLEHKKQGGPTALGEWSQALWNDGRIQAAWPVAAEQYAFIEYEKAREKAEDKGDPVPTRSKLVTDFSSFERRFKKIVDEETVPAGYPFGEDYSEMKRRLKKEVPERLKNVRGKLNVPRERFHLTAAGQYTWAAIQLREFVERAAR